MMRTVPPTEDGFLARMEVCAKKSRQASLTKEEFLERMEKHFKITYPERFLETYWNKWRYTGRRLEDWE